VEQIQQSYFLATMLCNFEDTILQKKHQCRKMINELVFIGSFQQMPLCYHLSQEWANSGPRAKYGPPQSFQ